LRSSISLIRNKLKEAAAHPGVRRYFFNTGWVFAEKILRLISGLFIGAYVARYLGPSQYGLLNYAISVVSIMSVLATVGLDSILIRELVKNEKQRDVLMGSAFAIRFCGTLVVLTLLAVINEVTYHDRLTKTLIYIVAGGTIFEMFGLIDFFFQARVLSKFVVWSQMIALICVSIFRIILIVNDAALVWFAWSSVLDFFVIAIGLMVFYHSNGFRMTWWKVDKAIVNMLLRDSWPLIFSALAVTIYLRIDQIMVKWMLGDAANGHYGVAVRLAELWNFIPVAICGSVFPAIINARSVNHELYIKRLQRLYDLMIVLSVSIAIVMTFVSGWIIVLLFGEDYSPATGILNWYIWSGVFVFLGVANGKWVITENLQMFRMVTLIIACVINIILNYVLIRTIGINGAAISTLVAYAFAGYFGFLLTQRTREMFFTMTESFNPFKVIKRFL
jgi:O-antigen/teichoic acid export membrane protein